MYKDDHKIHYLFIKVNSQAIDYLHYQNKIQKKIAICINSIIYMSALNHFTSENVDIFPIFSIIVSPDNFSFVRNVSFFICKCL